MTVISIVFSKQFMFTLITIVDCVSWTIALLLFLLDTDISKIQHLLYCYLRYKMLQEYNLNLDVISTLKWTLDVFRHKEEVNKYDTLHLKRWK